MTNAWDERKKALEEQYFKKVENDQIEKMREGKIDETVQCPR